MSYPEATIRINVDPANPGQFFACCGLLELADRFRNGAEAWFCGSNFAISSEVPLDELMTAVGTAELTQLDPEDKTASPIQIGFPFQELRLDWWKDDLAGGRELKVWAGTMESFRIAVAMQCALRNARFHAADLFNIGVVAYDPGNREKKVEPFYFDARRGPNAHSRDVGFSPNDLKITTTAFPAVEFLCLVGLQRCLPARTHQPRVFDYLTWTEPLPPELLPCAVCGLLPDPDAARYRFENWYRTGQRKHKAFLPAVPVSSRGVQ